LVQVHIHQVLIVSQFFKNASAKIPHLPTG
jgi:hypothetical protein